MTQPLTAMERRVYEYLLDFTAENTFQPSIREIGKRFRIKSTKTVSDILQALASKGFIERDASRSRGVRLLGFAGAARSMPVPLYNRLHAGEPALVPDFREGFLTIDRRFVPSERAFFLRVRGDGMNGAGIFDGDYVMVNPDGQPAAGDVVAARVGDTTAVGRYAVDLDGPALHGANGLGPAVRVSAHDDAGVLGSVCGVFRPMFDRGAEITEPLEIVTL
jgi:repressor LexA